MLSHFTIRTSRATEHKLLDNAYKQLGVMLRASMDFSEEMNEYKTTTKGRRLHQLTDEKILGKVQLFGEELVFIEFDSKKGLALLNKMHLALLN